MEEILDDEDIGLRNNENITFLKWWEGKRLFYNIFIFCLLALGFMGVFVNSNYRLEMDLFTLKVLLGFFVLCNLIYSIFSLTAFGFRLIIRVTNPTRINSFFQNKKIWMFLFTIQLLITTLGVLVVIIGGSPAVAPFPLSPGF